jgi:Flp pilus assembly protein TadD
VERPTRILEIRLGHPAEATEELRRILNANPKNTDARMNLALLLLNQGSLVEAAREFKDLIGISPSDHEALNSYGLTLLRMKEYQGALAAFRKSLQLDPDQPEVLLNLALVLASGSGSLQEAACIAQRALDLAIKKGNQELAFKIRGDLGSIARGERIEIGF